MSIEHREEIAQPSVHILWVQRHNLELILDGRKTREVRRMDEEMAQIQVGHTLRFNNRADCEKVVSGAAHYPTLEAIADHEDIALIDPTMSPQALLEKGRRMFPDDRRGFVVFAWENDETRMLRD